MSTSNPVRAWSNEDGDRWYAEGHHSDEAMREAAATFESEWRWREANAADFADGIVARVWLRPINPDDDETPFERVEEGAPGAQPWTLLDAELDHDAIDQRPQRRPAWAVREPSA